jgi:RNAse (barnase) inhibitor barstar
MNSVADIREGKLPAEQAWQLTQELRDHLDALWDIVGRDVEEAYLIS